MTEVQDQLRALIRNVPDFPKPGIQFKDIAPLLQDGPALRGATELLAARYKGVKIDGIAAPEARGFIFGATLALHLGLGFLPIRKAGKLPFETASITYDLEYGTDTVEIHKDSIRPGDRILLVDDVLATGGTMAACAQLVESLGGTVVGCAFLLELGELGGRAKLKDHQIEVILTE